MRKQTNDRKQSGFSILEVVIGIFIFVVGMLALAALQGALSRSMADAKLRTTAINLADRMIERQRGFTQLLTAVTPGQPFAYNDITTPGTDPTIVRNGVTYTIDMNVTDYYYQLATDTFTTTNTLGASSSDYKQVDVTVSWDAVQDFRAGEGEVIDADDINTGSVTLTSTIPAVITSASGRVSDESDGSDLNHEVTYQPGSNPDVVALDLGDSKFKESLLPEPDVIRNNELVQTTFDVVTYSQSGGTTFLRREEFAAVSCECTLRAASSDNPARRPVIWAGDEYAAGHFVVKPYGESANNKNSSLCDSCCRDHHDGGTKQAGDSDDPYANVSVLLKPMTNTRAQKGRLTTSITNRTARLLQPMVIRTLKPAVLCVSTVSGGWPRISEGRTSLFFQQIFLTGLTPMIARPTPVTSRLLRVPTQLLRPAMPVIRPVQPRVLVWVISAPRLHVLQHQICKAHTRQLWQAISCLPGLNWLPAR